MRFWLNGERVQIRLGEVFYMFEKSTMIELRKTCLCEEQRPDYLKQMILLALREYKVSLSQARGLFDEIIIQIEDSPIR